MVGWHHCHHQWRWVWVNSGRWWWTGKPGVLWSMWSQRAGYDWVTEQQWVYSFLLINTIISLIFHDFPHFRLIHYWNNCQLRKKDTTCWIYLEFFAPHCEDKAECVKDMILKVTNRDGIRLGNVHKSKYLHVNATILLIPFCFREQRNKVIPTGHSTFIVCHCHDFKMCILLPFSAVPSKSRTMTVLFNTQNTCKEKMQCPRAVWSANCYN